MNNLLRELAPITPEAWAQIDNEAKRTLKLMLAARRLVDFNGPLGSDVSALSDGRVEDLASPIEKGVEGRLRKARTLVELRVPFELSRQELEAIGRGAQDPNLDPVRHAARAAAIAEDRAIFLGYPQAHIAGIAEASASSNLTLSEDYEAYPQVVAEATNKLRGAGVGGPYAIALGPRCFAGLTRTTKGGYPVMEHVRRLLDGPIVWAPAADGAIVMSLRGGDFELAVGQDFSIGYLDHTATTVRLYLQESFTFRVLAPEAAVPLRYPSASEGRTGAAASNRAANRERRG
ncbi:MAG: bacteriocin [Betaproteobacteria bacterium]|nr:bacteriocin [Betaproteobacteria bacterium]